MNEQASNLSISESPNTNQLSEQEKKYGRSIFKKWIYAKFDAKIILEVVEKGIYFNPKLSILLPTLNPNGKKTFLSATLDLKGLQNLHKELSSAISILEDHTKNNKKE